MESCSSTLAGLAEPANIPALPATPAEPRQPATESQASPLVIAQVMQCLRAFVSQWASEGDDHPWMSLNGLDPDALVELDRLLGEGEVRFAVDGEVIAWETAFVGLWRGDSEGAPYLEAGMSPSRIDALRTGSLKTPTPRLDEQGLMNAPAVMIELEAAVRAWQQRGDRGNLNLTQLPLTSVDQAWLETQLGRGSVAAVSLGFGRCEVLATAWPDVWWVRYFNDQGHLILNSLEITDLPVAAQADAADIAISRTRFGDWLAVLEESVNSGHA